MVSQGWIRGLLNRLAATFLVALLAGTSVAPCAPRIADERDESSAHSPGMDAPPGPTATAALSLVTGPVLQAPPASAARGVVAFSPVACGRPTARTLRLVVPSTSAPTILRV